MSIDIEKLIKLNNLVTLSLRKKNLIILNPEERKDQENLDENIIYDEIEWKITQELSKYIEKLSNDNNLSIENKILQIYEKICLDYIYDDNLISYIKKIDDDTYSIPDWYGRAVDQEWEKNRESHNRRVCYELSRYLAKSLTELLKDNDEFNVCIHWNKDLTHYFVGLTSDEYSLILDVDNFFNIKDLTRLKMDLTAEGIEILEDKNNKFRNTLEEFNKDKSKYAINKIKKEMKDNNTINSDLGTQSVNKIEEHEDIAFFTKVMEILANKYDMDSQGIYEYMKEIVDIKLGSEEREKIWKKIEGNSKESTRYIRCLLLNIDNQKILIDVDKKILRQFDEKELTEKRTNFISYKDLSRGGFDYYDGT